jgi:transcriptional regulator with XRE-family HTH domain
MESTSKRIETVGQRLRRLREARELSAGEVGRRIRMGGPHVLRVEKGEHQPGFFMVTDLAKLYGVSLDYIAGLTNDDSLPRAPDNA